MPSQPERSCPRVGLVTGDVSVPLQGVTVEARLKDFCARVVVTQKYRNEETKPIEAVYVFPLDQAAAVCGFEAIVDGAHVVGEVKAREQAFEDYDDALAEGHGAYLLDQEKPDVFTASIGNVPPGKEVAVRLTYVTELPREGSAVRFVLPTTVSPRYAPDEDRKGVGRTPAEALNPPLAWEVPYGLTLTVDIEMPTAIRGVESPTHPIAADLAGTRATVRLGERETTLDRDFVLDVRLDAPEKPRAWIEVDEAGRRAALLAFVADLPTEEQPAETIFVVDRSGSMQGSSIAEARNTLQLCLRSLPAGSRFNIVGFGSTVEMLFPESRRYDDRSLEEASRHVKAMDANLGGTEILAPLRVVLEKPVDPKLPRQVFVLTDGEVTNTEAVLELVRKHSETTRLFAFGIGHGPSRHLVQGMARAGRGASEFISPKERIEEKVVRMLARALAPALGDVKVDWGGLNVKQAPHYVPPLFAGGRLLVYGFLEEARAGDVTLSAASARGPVSFSLRVDPEYAVRGNIIGTLAARARIRDLEEGMSPLHDRRGSLQERTTKDHVKEEIVRLGVTYQLVSRATSFIAVEKRDTPVQGEMQLRRVPIALTRDWGELALGASMVFFGSPRLSPSGAVPASAPQRLRSSAGFLGRMLNFGGPSQEMSDLSLEMDSPSPEPTMPEAKKRPLDRLVALQQANGSWDLTKDLAEILGTPLDVLEKKLVDAVRDRTEARRAWGTALAILWLKIEASNEVGEWTLLEKKARAWLRSSTAKLASGEEWLDAASTFYSRKPH